jgi:hypothetical protein
MLVRHLCMVLALAAILLTSAGCSLCHKNSCSSSSASPCCPPAPCCDQGGAVGSQAYSVPAAPGCYNGR